jgi:hypothetical protein
MDNFDLGGKSIFQSTPKEKKKYILFLYTMNHDNSEKIRSIERTIQKTLKNFIMVRLEDPDEGLKALLVKNIEIVVIDSSFFNDDNISVEYATECKKRRKCPIFFIAKDPSRLIEQYRKKLFRYEEFDNYFPEPVDLTEFSKKLHLIENSKGRSAKRFSINIPVQMFRLNKNQTYSVTLTDISLVGFGILMHTQEILAKNEQVQIKIPLYLFRFFHENFGEFLPLSGKLRRISINGELLGFSLEHITTMQMEALAQLLTIIHYKSKLIKFPEKPKEAGQKKINSSDLI